MYTKHILNSLALDRKNRCVVLYTYSHVGMGTHAMHVPIGLVCSNEEHIPGYGQPLQRILWDIFILYDQ